MKYREGKIPVEELFQKEYFESMEGDFEFERKLSPFWEEVKFIEGEQSYVNYLTCEITSTFHEWKAIKGGILAD